MEKIYGMMITGQNALRYAYARIAIDCFAAQTYPEKELVIVNHGNVSLAGEGITEIMAKNNGITLGEYRNMALTYVPKGSPVIVWDDDDFKHPKLISEQYKHMRRKEADACVLLNQTLYHKKTNCLLTSGPFFHVMSIMFRNHRKVLYPAMECNEDGVFFSHYGNKHKIVHWDNPVEYFIRQLHGENTSVWPDSFHEWFVPNTWLTPTSMEPYYREAIAKYRSMNKPE